MWFKTDGQVLITPRLASAWQQEWLATLPLTVAFEVLCGKQYQTYCDLRSIAHDLCQRDQLALRLIGPSLSFVGLFKGTNFMGRKKKGEDMMKKITEDAALVGEMGQVAACLGEWDERKEQVEKMTEVRRIQFSLY